MELAFYTNCRIELSQKMSNFPDAKVIIIQQDKQDLDVSSNSPSSGN